MADLCVSLVAAGLAGHSLDESQMPETLDWKLTYAIVSSHGVEALAWEGLPECVRVGMPAEITVSWRNAVELTLFRQLSYDAERDVILKDLRMAGLSWLPLKGIHTATYYPRLGLRSMGDQDLVFGFVDRNDQGVWAFRGTTDAERRAWDEKADAIVTEIMERHGYRKINDWERELSFAKTGLQFEFHRSIVAHAERSLGYYGDEALHYYANPWRKAIPDDRDLGNELFSAAVSGTGSEGIGFHWSPEDEYLFHVSHMMKHAQASGFGFRFLADEAVFCHRFGATFDWDYIHDELHALGATRFEQTIRDLSLAIFDHPQDWKQYLDDGQRERLDEIISNGTYGTRQNALRNSFRRQADTGKAKASRPFERARQGLLYGWGRIYPSIEWVELSYPEWAGSRWKRAILPLYRLYRGLRRHPADLLYELRLMLHGR